MQALQTSFFASVKCPVSELIFIYSFFFYLKVVLNKHADDIFIRSPGVAKLPRVQGSAQEKLLNRQ